MQILTLDYNLFWIHVFTNGLYCFYSIGGNGKSVYGFISDSQNETLIQLDPGNQKNWWLAFDSTSLMKVSIINIQELFLFI